MPDIIEQRSSSLRVFRSAPRRRFCWIEDGRFCWAEPRGDGRERGKERGGFGLNEISKVERAPTAERPHAFAGTRRGNPPGLQGVPRRWAAGVRRGSSEGTTERGPTAVDTREEALAGRCGRGSREEALAGHGGVGRKQKGTAWSGRGPWNAGRAHARPDDPFRGGDGGRPGPLGRGPTTGGHQRAGRRRGQHAARRPDVAVSRAPRPIGGSRRDGDGRRRVYLVEIRRPRRLPAAPRRPRGPGAGRATERETGSRRLRRG